MALCRSNSCGVYAKAGRPLLLSSIMNVFRLLSAAAAVTTPALTNRFSDLLIGARNCVCIASLRTFVVAIPFCVINASTTFRSNLLFLFPFSFALGLDFSCYAKSFQRVLNTSFMVVGCVRRVKC